jgi:hypothetical protein
MKLTHTLAAWRALWFLVALAVVLGLAALSQGRAAPADPRAAAFARLRPNPQARGWNLAVTAPRSGQETLANWSRFRVAHLAAEGARRAAPRGRLNSASLPLGRRGC